MSKKVYPCSICKHAVFIAKWGEYKCPFLGRRVMEPGCPAEKYEPGEPEMSKNNKEYYESMENDWND